MNKDREQRAEKDRNDRTNNNNNNNANSNGSVKSGGEGRVSNSFWVYNIVQNKWNSFYKNDNDSPEYWCKTQNVEPRPRYAHQLVYDGINRVRSINELTLVNLNDSPELDHRRKPFRSFERCVQYTFLVCMTFRRYRLFNGPVQLLKLLIAE